jgi:hypothetical protein
MSGWIDFVTTPEFWTGAFVSGLLASGVAYLSTRNSDKRKMEHEDLKSNRQIVREATIAFSEVCSSVIEKAIDSKGAFNAVMHFVQNMQNIPDKKALEKVEFAVDLMDEAKRITTAFNNLRVVAPVSVFRDDRKYAGLTPLLAQKNLAELYGIIRQGVAEPRPRCLQRAFRRRALPLRGSRRRVRPVWWRV